MHSSVPDQLYSHRHCAGVTATLRGLCVLLACLMCSGCYLMQAAQGQLAISSQRRPIEEVIESPNTSPVVQRRLQLIVAAREFASRELALPDNQSYRSYVELNREFVVWNVFATPRYSVEPRRWCFPIAGCVVYRGYFAEADARNYALRARMRGDDSIVAGTTAYSTLGHFDDPVVSTMLKYSDAQIAATLFHELAHQVHYWPNESDLNEAFASVVEEEGARRWLTTHGDAAAFAAWELARSRQIAFSQLLLSTRDRLRNLYRDAPHDAELYFRKQREFGRLKFEYSQLKSSWNGYAGYDQWFNRALNNADLVSAATYERCMPGMRALLQANSNDLPKFYDAMGRLTDAERRSLCPRSM